MSFSSDYVLEVGDEKIHLLSDYANNLRFEEVFDSASSHTKMRGLPSRLYRNDDKTTVAEFNPDGTMVASRFIFISIEDGATRTKEFGTIGEALKHARRWTIDHRCSTSETDARVLSGTCDGTGCLWRTCWTFEKLDVFPVWYSLNSRDWFVIDYVENTSEDLRTCLVESDGYWISDLGEHFDQMMFSLEPHEDASFAEDWDEAYRMTLMMALGREMPSLIIERKLSIREAIVTLMQNMTDMDSEEIADYINNNMNLNMNVKAVERAESDARLKFANNGWNYDVFVKSYQTNRIISRSRTG